MAAFKQTKLLSNEMAIVAIVDQQQQQQDNHASIFHIGDIVVSFPNIQDGASFHRGLRQAIQRRQPTTQERRTIADSFVPHERRQVQLSAIVRSQRTIVNRTIVEKRA
jgi:hypothetical protein